MINAAVVRYEARSDAAADENEKLVRQVFDELNRERPEGLRYAALRLADRVGFVHLVIVDGDADPLSASAAFAEFRGRLADRVVGPPERTPATVVGSYRF